MVWERLAGALWERQAQGGGEQLAESGCSKRKCFFSVVGQFSEWAIKEGCSDWSALVLIKLTMSQSFGACREDRSLTKVGLVKQRARSGPWEHSANDDTMDLCGHCQKVCQSGYNQSDFRPHLRIQVAPYLHQHWISSFFLILVFWCSIPSHCGFRFHLPDN